MAFFTLETDEPSETDDPSSKSKNSKLSEKQMLEVRQIVHPKLRPFNFKLERIT